MRKRREVRRDLAVLYAYGANTSSLTSTVKERDNIVRAGINYRLF